MAPTTASLTIEHTTGKSNRTEALKCCSGHTTSDTKAHKLKAVFTTEDATKCTTAAHTTAVSTTEDTNIQEKPLQQEILHGSPLTGREGIRPL